MTDNNLDLNNDDEQEVEVYFLGQNDTHRAYYQDLAEQEEDDE